MANPSHVGFFLSGGASNSDPLLALGGAISSTQIRSATLTTSTFSGITYLDAANCTAGTATVHFTTPSSLSWTPPGGTQGGAVDIATNGTYALQGGDGRATLFVSKSGALPGAGSNQSVTVTLSAQTLFDDVQKVEAADGETEYRCVFIKNTHASDAMSTVTLVIESAPSIQETISFGLDSAGKNGTPASVANENTAPNSVTFTSGALLIGSLSAGDYYPVWIARAVAAQSKIQVASDSMILSVRFQ